MRLLKVCPMCLGDMIVEPVAGEVRSHCVMCRYRSPSERRPAAPARNRNAGLMTTRHRHWPYATDHHLHPAHP